MKKSIVVILVGMLSFEAVAECSPSPVQKTPSVAIKPPASKQAEANVTWLPAGKCVAAYTHNPQMRWVCAPTKAKPVATKQPQKNKQMKNMQAMQQQMMAKLAKELDGQRAALEAKIEKSESNLASCLTENKNASTAVTKEKQRLAAEMIAGQKAMMSQLNAELEGQRKIIDAQLLKSATDLKSEKQKVMLFAREKQGIAANMAAGQKAMMSQLNAELEGQRKIIDAQLLKSATDLKAANQKLGLLAGEKQGMAAEMMAGQKAMMSQLNAELEGQRKEIDAQLLKSAMDLKSEKQKVMLLAGEKQGMAAEMMASQKAMMSQLNAELEGQRKVIDAQLLKSAADLKEARRKMAVLASRVSEEKRTSEKNAAEAMADAEKLKQAQKVEATKVEKLKSLLSIMTKNHEDVRKIADDLDRDGVKNEADFCARTPETTVVALTGCGAEEEIELVLFDVESDRLKDTARVWLNHVAMVLQHHQDQVFVVHGHTDNTGYKRGNLALSEARALTVLRYLENHGALSSQLEIAAEGAKMPIANNAMAEGRASNRRAVLGLKP